MRFKTIHLVSLIVLSLCASCSSNAIRQKEEHSKSNQQQEEDTTGFLKMAKTGNTNAQFMLGLCYYTGKKGAPQDFDEAAKWLKKAADQGHVKAQYFLAGMYRGGQGVSRDYDEAAKWFEKAAQQDDKGAQRELGRLMCLKGNLTTNKRIQAYMWLYLAAGKKVDSEDTWISELSKTMTKSQIQKAQQLAREWQPLGKSVFFELLEPMPDSN